MKPANEIEAETARILGGALTRVVTDAIEPQLGPLRRSADTLRKQGEAMSQQVDTVDGRLDRIEAVLVSLPQQLRTPVAIPRPDPADLVALREEVRLRHRQQLRALRIATIAAVANTLVVAGLVAGLVAHWLTR